MQVELLKNIVTSIAGPQATGIVDLLYNKKNVNEFLISKKLNLTINQTRNILYRLADEGLVHFVRKKDKKKGGWYTYFWTLDVEKGLLKFRERLISRINQLKGALNSRKTEIYYHCENCDIESNEENALTYNYMCPECGEVLKLKDKSDEIEQIQKEIEKLEGVLVGVDNEVQIVEKKDLAAKNRKLKVEAKKKSLEREARKKKREREKKKLEKKLGKKKSAKKKKLVKKKAKKNVKKKVKKKPSKKKKPVKKKAKKKGKRR